MAGITKLDDGLKRLDKMTNDEARMANAEVLRVAHNIDEKVEGVDKKVQGVGTQIKDVDERVQGVNKDVQGVSVQVQGVDENVKMVKEKVQMVIDGAQTVLSYSLTPPLIFNQLDGKEATTEVKLVMRQMAYNVDDVNRSSSVLSSPTVKYLTRSQGGNCERASEDGSLLRTRLQITTSRAISNTKERPSGSVTATSLRNGR